MLKKYIGTKKFYKMMLAIAIPIMVQNGITNFVGMLDNIMIGQIGTEQMSGVSIINQLMFVFNLCIFGAISGAGIFGAQFYGNGNHKGIRDTFRFKLILCAVISILGIVIFLQLGDDLINLYLHEETYSGNLELILNYGKDYLKIMLFGLIPFALNQVYTSTLRETGETVLPMKSGIAAVLVNLVFNYILIYGKLGAPALGVQGAAIATVISRVVECSITIVWTHQHKTEFPFIQGVYKSLKIPGSLVRDILIKGTPLMLNEAFWASGMAVMTQLYSTRGPEVIAAFNIQSTLSNVFNIVFLAMGNSVAIILGQQLGAKKMDEAKETAGKLIFFSVACCVVIALIMTIFAPLFPQIYNTEDNIKELASKFIIIAACVMPLNACTNASYFTLRSGGKTIITFLFDSVFVWGICIPTAYCLTKFTSMTIIPIFIYCQLLEAVKTAIGITLVKKGVWLNNIVVK